MAETNTLEDLLETCVQDLYAARGVAVDRLPEIIEQAGSSLAEPLRAIRRNYQDQMDRFESADFNLDGPENLWMAGIMDDAERDTESTKAGRLLDTALIGAVRKGLAADEVSLETAMVVAQALKNVEACEMLDAMRERCRKNDDGLKQLLHELN